MRTAEEYRALAGAIEDGSKVPFASDIADALREAAEMREALEAFVEWDKAENNAPPYDSDNGAHWRMRTELCRTAFARARAILGGEPHE